MLELKHKREQLKQALLYYKYCNQTKMTVFMIEQPTVQKVSSGCIEKI